MDVLFAYHGMARGSVIFPFLGLDLFSSADEQSRGLLYVLMTYIDISYLDVMHCDSSVYLVECIDGVNQQDSACTIIIKDLGHGVYGGISTRTEKHQLLITSLHNQ